MKYFLTLLSFLVAINVSGQFYYLGNAQPMDDECVMLTPDEPYSEGIAYSTNTIDLKNIFVIDFELYLGDKDEGADGITFVMHTDPRGFEAFGTYGECMGYGRWNPEYPYGSFISPSLAFEFDTYFNPTQNDPEGDHMAYLENGTNYHFIDVKRPLEPGNIEDGRLHNFVLRWDAVDKVLRVWFDGELRFEIKKDLFKEIFNENVNVIWGFTASTGRKHNLQYFCLKKFAYLPNSIERNLAYDPGQK